MENTARESTMDTRFEPQYQMPPIPFALGPVETESENPVITIEEDVTESVDDMIRRNVFSITDPASEDGDLDEDDDTLNIKGTTKARLKSTGIVALSDLYGAGVIDTENVFFGDEGSCSYWDVVILKDCEHKKTVWAGIPFRSSLFIYEMNGQVEMEKGERSTWQSTNGVRMLSGHTVIRCNTWMVKPVKLTLTILKEQMLAGHLGCSGTLLDKIIQEGPWQFDPAFEIGDDNFKWNEYEITVDHIQQCQRMCKSKPLEFGFLTAMTEMEDRSIFTRFFYNTIVECLLEYYAEKIVFGLPWTKLELLYKRLRTNPFALAFEQTIDVTTREKDLGGKFKKVPELTKELYVTAMRVFTPTTRQGWHMTAVQVYAELRRQLTEERHTYTTVNEICLALTGLTAKEVDTTVDKLCDIQVLTRNGKYIYLTMVHEWDLCVSYGLRNTLGNFLESKQSTYTTTEETEAHITSLMETTSLCDEQLKAMRCFLTSPFTLIQGTAGSGKTEFIKHAIKSYQPEELMLTAFQGKNSGDLGAFVKGRAFTVHMLLYAHAATCECLKWGRWHGWVPPPPKTPAEREAATKKKLCEQLNIKFDVCPFEKIKVLVVDELSTMYGEIFGKLVCAMAHCGALERIIMTGDINQLPSIQAGNLLRDLDKALYTVGAVCKFKHNHRVTEASKLLVQNSTNIAQNNPIGLRFDGKVALHIPLSIPDYKNEHVAAQVLNLIKTYSLPESNTHIITRTNATRRLISEAVDRFYLLKENPKANFEWKAFHVGRKIMFKRNIYPLGVLNNEVLFLRGITDEYEKKLEDGNVQHEVFKVFTTNAPQSRKTAFGEEYKRWLLCEPADQTRGKMPSKRIPWSKDTKRYASRASATTNHAFQGGQIHTIIHVMPYPTKQYDTRESVYTAETRGQCRWFFVGAREWLDQAISQPEPARRTDLVEKIFKNIPEDMLMKLPGRQAHVALNKATLLAEAKQLEDLQKKHPANKRKVIEQKPVTVIVPSSPEPVVKKQKKTTTTTSSIPIRFFSNSAEYSEFSNFHAAPTKIEGKTWPTVEHYFQAMKFSDDPAYQQQIRKAGTPAAAKKLGSSRDHPIRADWEKVKEATMLCALEAKFDQHPVLAMMLLGTGDRPLHETTNDSYWGIGKDGKGKNRLGHLLDVARDALRLEIQWNKGKTKKQITEENSSAELQHTDSEKEETIESSEEEEETKGATTYEELVRMGAIKFADGYEGEDMDEY